MNTRLTLGERAARGVAWSMIGTFGGRSVSLASLAVLARLLAPEDFGLLAFALVFLTYVETVGDLGTSAALIYWPGRWKEVAQLTFIANLIMGGIWVLLSFAAAPVVADFFGSPHGIPVLRTLCWVVLIKAVGNTHDALLQRDLRFRARAAPELVLLTTKALVSVVLAIMGFGVWSLVWGQLVGQALATFLLWGLVPWRPGLRISKETLGPVLRYGRGIVSVNVIASVVHHVDFVIVGRMLGVTTLGIYQMAYKVPDIAVTLLVRVTSKVLFPALARLRDSGGALKGLFLPALRYLGLITIPGTVFLAVMAEPIVLTLFGDQWVASTPILRAIAVYAGIRALGSCTGDILKATGRPGILAVLGMVRAAVLLPSLLLAAGESALAVAWTLTAVAGLSTVANLAIACTLLRSPASELAGALRPGIGSALPLLGLLLAWAEISQGFPAPLTLVLGGLLGMAGFLASVRVFSPEIYREASHRILARWKVRNPKEPSPSPVEVFS